MKKTSVIFVGTGDLGKPVLEKMLKDERIVIPFIVTGKDKPKGRGMQLGYSGIKEIGILNKLIIHQPEKISDLKQEIVQANADFLLVTDFGEIIPKSILSLAKIAPINIHPSLLPKYRGPTPMHAPLLNGDTVTGVSWMVMGERMDAGDIIHQEKMDISPNDDYLSLSSKLSTLAGEKTPNVLLNFKANPKQIPQSEEDAIYCKRIDKEDGYIDPQKETADQILAKIKAYCIWPGCTFFWNNTRLKIIKASKDEQKISSGEIVTTSDLKMLLGTVKGAVSFEVVQPESKARMKIEDYLRGKRVK